MTTCEAALFLHATLEAQPIHSLPITGIYSEQASLSIAALALKRVCHEEAIEQCEDPLLDAKYLELCLNSWKQLTPKRLSSVVCQEDVRAEPTLDYHKYRCVPLPSRVLHIYLTFRQRGVL